MSYSSEAADVTVEQIMVSVGQEIKQGDLLLKLTEESVDEITSHCNTCVAPDVRAVLI